MSAGCSRGIPRYFVTPLEMRMHPTGLVILLYEQRRQQGAGEGEVGRRRSGPVR